MKKHANTLRVLSYNIHKGFRTGGKKFVLYEIRKLLHETEVDLVFLQEVVGAHSKHAKRIPQWPDSSQHEFLAMTAWSEHTYGMNAVYQDGHHGNAILSRFSIVRSENVDISTNRRERRGLLHSKVQLGDGRTVHACCTHLDLTKRGRSAQLRHLCEFLTERIPRDEPLILAGDFNDWTKKLSEPLEEKLGLKEVIELTHGKLRPTFPSSLPVLSLDRIYVRGLNVVGAKILRGAGWKKLSDHVPVEATLELTGNAP